MKFVPYLPICIPAKFGKFWSTISLDFAFYKLKAVGINGKELRGARIGPARMNSGPSQFKPTAVPLVSGSEAERSRHLARAAVPAGPRRRRRPGRPGA